MKIACITILTLFVATFSLAQNKSIHDKIEYICTPCDLACDTLTFEEPGTCPHCTMDLIKKREKERVINDIDIQTGSGFFLMEGGIGNRNKTIKVFYHKPENFHRESKIVLVIPGAGRNGDSYRDAWITESEQHSLLILSPMYPERVYRFEDYHLGGLIKESNLMNNVTYVEDTNIARLNENSFSFKVNTNADEWIFNDFDRLFDLVSQALNSTQLTYDVFGHSAGGHILHRFALFHEDSKANNIISANSSFYTLPNFEDGLPFGLKDTPFNNELLESAFHKKLILFLGELDNEKETGGTFLRSKSADKQGLHRLERGKFFFKKAKEMAEELGCAFNWEMVIVPNVGHNHRKMGDAAGVYLYESQKE